jgi:DNA invertase Pin-like site-specific DNA recombinase
MAIVRSSLRFERVQALPSRQLKSWGVPWVAERELGFISDRQRAGSDAAKAKGVYNGRPVTFDRTRIVALRKEGMGATEIAVENDRSPRGSRRFISSAK